MATVNITTSQNLSTVVYNIDDDLVIGANVTLTITATPSKRIRSISATTGGGTLSVQNTSTTNMLKLSFTPGGQGAITNGIASLNFQAGATCQFSGDWITVYTGNGTSNQTVLSSLTVGGQLLDYPAFVEVETGSGTGIYEKWAVVPDATVSNFYNSQYGYNAPYYTGPGTVAVASNGTVTGTSTNFLANLLVNKRFRAAGQATDYVISSVSTTTSMGLMNADEIGRAHV